MQNLGIGLRWLAAPFRLIREMHLLRLEMIELQHRIRILSLTGELGQYRPVAAPPVVPDLRAELARRALSAETTPPFPARERTANATPGGRAARKSLSPSVRPHTAIQGPCEVRK